MSCSDTDSKLFSHFLVMGVDINKEEVTYSKIHDGHILPSFLDVYPSFASDSPPESLARFHTLGFHDGFKIYDENKRLLFWDQGGLDLSAMIHGASKSEDIRQKTDLSELIYSFVMTDSGSNRRYCSSLLFYEKCYIKDDQAYMKKERSFTLMPKGPLQDLTKYPYTMNNHNLIYLPKSVSLISSSPCFDTQRQILQFMYKSLFARKQEGQTAREIKIPKKWVEQLENLVIGHPACEEFNIDEIWNQAFPDRYQLHMKLGNNDDCYLVKESQLKEFYISVLFSLMNKSSHPSEKILMNLLNQDNEEELARYRTSKTTILDSPYCDYRHLFQKLSPENIMILLRCILLEKQIMFFSVTPGDIPYITEALFGLLNPLKWCCMYVPFFPIFLWEHLQALFPYIVGLNSSYKSFIMSNVDMTDKIIVDLDSNQITYSNITDLPRKPQEFLLSNLKDMFARTKLRSCTTKEEDQEFWLELTLHLRHYANIFMLELINNHLPFYQIPSDFSHEMKYNNEDIFNSEKYLEQFYPDDRIFVTEIHNTMSLTNFISETFDLLFTPEHANKSQFCTTLNEVYSFIIKLKEIEYHITTKLSGLQRDPVEDGTPSILYPILHQAIINKIKDMNSPPVHWALTRYKNPMKVDLLPYLVKYYYHVFHTKKTLDHLKCDAPQKAVRRSRHSRNMSFADMISIRNDDTKYLNQSCQYFKSLNKSSVFNLEKMFDGGASSSRKSSHRSVDIIPDLLNKLSDPAKLKNSLRMDKRSVTYTPSLDSIGLTKKQQSEGVVVASMPSLPSLRESKPEIVKRVIKKLETEEFTFKRQSRRRVAAGLKSITNVEGEPLVSNDTENRPLRKVEKETSLEREYEDLKKSNDHKHTVYDRKKEVGRRYPNRSHHY